jgi:hypothetical protein
MAVKEAFKEALYLYNILQYLNSLLDLGIPIKKPNILEDNQSTIKIAENPEFHKRTKHIDIIYHWTREVIQNKQAELHYIPTADILADGFTKGLAKEKHNIFIQGMNLKEIK